VVCVLCWPPRMHCSEVAAWSVVSLVLWAVCVQATLKQRTMPRPQPLASHLPQGSLIVESLACGKSFRHLRVRLAVRAVFRCLLRGQSPHFTRADTLHCIQLRTWEWDSQTGPRQVLSRTHL